MVADKIGRYEIKYEIGRGGMSTVYHAYDPRFKRDVAIKVMPRALLHDPTFRERFEREAETIASLDHPAVVPVYDFGEEDGQPYLVMRLMTNGSLEDRIQQGPLTVAEAAHILTQLAPALDEAHSRGVVHRDLKPGNILFDHRNLPYLTDFGIVKIMQSPTTLTGNAILGTPAYMSPEQGRGEHDIDGRSDIYSLGAILFEMLTGKVPYDSETPTGQIIQHINDPIPDIMLVRQDLPKDCQMIIARAMAKRKHARYATVKELAQALGDVSKGKSLPSIKATYIEPLDSKLITTQRQPVPVKNNKPVRRYPVWLTIFLSLALLASLTAVAWPTLIEPILAKSPTATPYADPDSQQTAAGQISGSDPLVTATDTVIPPTPTTPVDTATQEVPTDTSTPTDTSIPTLTPTATILPTNTPFPTLPPTATPTKVVKPTKTPTPPPPPRPSDTPPPPPAN